MSDPKELIKSCLSTIKSLLGQVDGLNRVVTLIITSVRTGGRIYLLGNGGSAADAQHLAAELVGRFRKDRPAIAASALTTDSSVLTSIANDYGFDTVFERQVEAYVLTRDVVIGITTSGTSPNVVRALRKAKELGAATVLFTGAGWKCPAAGREPAEADEVIAVDSQDTARIQEAHILVGHIICHLVEEELYGATSTEDAGAGDTDAQ